MTKERMTKDEALKLAMEGLEDPLAPTKRLKAITAIKEVVAQQEQDEKFCDANCVWTDHHPDCKLAQPEQKKCENCGEFGECCQAQPSGSVEQEPVAWRFRSGTWFNREAHWRYINTVEGTDGLLGLEPLYTAPPQRKPLTDEQIADIAAQGHQRWLEFARAIEAAHGIKGAITAIKEALAQREQKPVAWMHIENYIDEDNLWDSRKLFRDYDNGFGVPLYTAPPTWVGLTDEEKLVANQMWRVMDADGFIQAIETKLKQKNGFAEEKNT